MSRKLLLCVLMLGLAFGASSGITHARADDDERSHESDGPAPVNTEESLTAGASDDVAESALSTSKLKLNDSGDEHPAGSYAGVEPGGGQAPPVPAAPGMNPPTITWPGFQMRPDGTSRVFVQSTASIPAQTSMVPGKFIVRFPGAHIAGETNRFALETRFFNTPVTRVDITALRDAAVITLELRAEVRPTVSTERGPSGYYFTYIDLPAGQFIDTPNVPSAAAAPPAPTTSTPGNGDPKFLDGDLDLKAKAKAKASASGGVHVDTSMDNELPPGIKATSKTQSKAQAGASMKLGK